MSSSRFPERSIAAGDGTAAVGSDAGSCEGSVSEAIKKSGTEEGSESASYEECASEYETD